MECLQRRTTWCLPAQHSFKLLFIGLEKASWLIYCKIHPPTPTDWNWKWLAVGLLSLMNYKQNISIGHFIFLGRFSIKLEINQLRPTQRSPEIFSECKTFSNGDQEVQIYLECFLKVEMHSGGKNVKLWGNTAFCKTSFVSFWAWKQASYRGGVYPPLTTWRSWQSVIILAIPSSAPDTYNLNLVHKRSTLL